MVAHHCRSLQIQTSNSEQRDLALGLGRLGWRPLGSKASSPSHPGAASGMCQPRHLLSQEFHTRCMKQQPEERCLIRGRRQNPLTDFS